MQGEFDLVEKKTVNVKILIATHKKYRMPKDEIYLPLNVGAEEKKDVNGNSIDLGYVKDNTGENISIKNACFCELTGLYWAWKNLDADYIGLTHYRRHFSLKGRQSSDLFKDVLTGAELQLLIKTYRVIVPKKRRYYIESLYSHYQHTHHANQLDVTREIIFERYPEYLHSYDKVIKHTYGYMFNMIIMEKELLNNYCTWLFDILFELEKRIDMPELSAFQSRFYGRVSEIILNVWLDYQIESGKLKQSDIKEIPFIHMEKINWYKKGTAFLRAKFFHRKYVGSF